MSGENPTASTDTAIVPVPDLDAAQALGLVRYARLDADELLDRLRAWAVRADGAATDNTWRAWRADIQVWCAWCRAGGRVAFPVTPTDVAAFFAGAGAHGGAVATIRRYIAILSRLYRSARAPARREIQTIR